MTEGRWVFLPAWDLRQRHCLSWISRVCPPEPADQAGVELSGESWPGSTQAPARGKGGAICAFSALFHLVKISPEGAIPNKTEVAV
jgi:hypothetical protein